MNDINSTAKRDKYISSRRNVQSKLRQIQDKWLSDKADEIQKYADTHDMKRFYNALNDIYGPKSSGSSPLLSKDGTTRITEKVKILERWVEHFHSVLNRQYLKDIWLNINLFQLVKQNSKKAKNNHSAFPTVVFSG